MILQTMVTQISQTANPQQFFTQNILELVLNSGRVAKIVLGVLFLFSVISWGVILDKFRVFGRVRRQSNKFLTLFNQKKTVREILQMSKQYPSNPFAAVFREAYWLLNKNEPQGQNPVGDHLDMIREQKAKSNHTPEDLVRLFDSVASREVLSLEKNLIFLATTSSVSPFLGLFGTVWGIMESFMAIGLMGSADLSVVAP